MRSRYSKDFFKYYNKGFDEFHLGEWSLAKELLQKALKLKRDDKPTQRMLDNMKKYNFCKPENFKQRF